MNEKGALEPLPKSTSSLVAAFAFLASFVLIFSLVSSVIFFEKHGTSSGAPPPPERRVSASD